MTVQHSSLTGANLHGTRIPSSSANRTPNYAGEAILEGGDLVIAQGTSQDSWQRFRAVGANQPQHGFSWCVSLTEYVPSASISGASLLYHQGTSATANNAANQGFLLLNTWIAEEDFAIDSVIDITPFIQRKGRGCYVFVLNGMNAYGGSFGIDDLLLGAIANPTSTVELFDFNVPFRSDTADVGIPSEWVNINGFEVLNPLSQVILNVENIP